MKPEGKPNGSMTQTNLNQVHIPQVHTPQAHRRILTPRHLTLTENAGPAAAGSAAMWLPASSVGCWAVMLAMYGWVAFWLS